VSDDPAFDRQALVEPELPGEDVLEDRFKVGRLGLRQEPDLAQVDAQERDVDLGDGSGRTQERAIAAEHHERVRRLQLLAKGVDVAGLRTPLIDATPTAPARGSSGEFDGRLDGRVVRKADALDRHASVTSAMRSGRSAQLGPAAMCARNSRLPSCPVMGDLITSRVPRPSVAAWAVTRSRTSRWTAGSRTIPRSVLPFPASNWGLTRAMMSACGARGVTSPPGSS